MRIGWVVGILLCAAACTSTEPVGSHQQSLMQVDTWQVRGNYANGGAGTWSYDEATNCYSSTGLYVWAGDQTTHTQGAPVPSEYGWVDYYVSTSCDGEWSYRWAGGALDADHFDLRRMSSADVTLDVPVVGGDQTCDENWNCTWNEFVGHLQGTVTLTGVGDTYRGQSRDWYGYAAGPYRYSYRNRYNGTYRDATTTVDATLDGVPLAFTDSWGNIGSSNNSSINQYRY